MGAEPRPGQWEDRQRSRRQWEPDEWAPEEWAQRQWTDDLRWVEVLGVPTRVLDTGPGNAGPGSAGPGHADPGDADRTAGEAPVVLCCSGAASCLEDWLPVAQRLRGCARVVLFDRPSGSVQDLSGEVRRAAAVLEALGLDPSVHVTVLGHSMGALVAEAFARAFPERVARVVLVDGSVVSASKADRAPETDRAPAADPSPAPSLSDDLPAAVRVPIPARWARRAASWVGSRVGRGLALALAPGRRRLFRSFPEAAVAFHEGAFWARTVEDLVVYREWIRTLGRWRDRHPLPEGVTVVALAGGGRLPRLWLTRWSRAVLEQAHRLAEETDGTVGTVHGLVVARTGHFVQLDQPDWVTRVSGS